MSEHDIEEEEIEPRYQRLEATVGVMVPFEWDAEAGAYRLVLSELVTTVGGLFSDAEECLWVPDVDEWIGPDDAEMSAAFEQAWRFVNQVLATTRGTVQA